MYGGFEVQEKLSPKALNPISKTFIPAESPNLKP